MSRKKAKEIRRVARHDKDKAELRERILATARELVLRKGFAERSIRKLAYAIGYAPGTIYLYCKNRYEIVREICLRGFAELFEQMKSAADVVAQRERLAALLRDYANFGINKPETLRLSFME